MLTAQENELLTCIGPGTPAGALLRRYWQPIGVASELTQERPIQRLTVLGEELVLYREPAGAYGLVAEKCAHRGASLAYGFVEAGGLRCAYHGWKYDTTGTCLEQPFEPEGSTYKERVQQRAYPVEKLAGLLWAYFGPPDQQPLLPRWDVLVREDGERQLEIRQVDCNWLQVMENTADVTHTYFLHGHTMHQRGIQHRGAGYYYRPFKKYGFEQFEWGILKHWTYGGDQPESAKGHPLIFPNILRLWEDNALAMHWRVPIDDHRTRIFRVFFRAGAHQIGTVGDPPVKYCAPGKTPDGVYLMDSFPSQDQMAWETQGAVYDRSEEHLGASDRGIVLYRKLLREQIEVVRQNGEPMALIRDPHQNERIETIVHEEEEDAEGETEGYSVVPAQAMDAAGHEGPR